MKTLTTTQELAAFCTAAADYPYVTLDTEFLRERTYYSQLNLVQMAVPSDDKDSAVLVDPLAKGMSLEPLYDLFRNENVVKVFHSARQDLEIFWVDAGIFPSPLFDTQVAAMVCGFGDQVGYETLVRKICKVGLDKTSRFTDWSRRPLTNAQKSYALADVTHLRRVYEYLAAELKKSNRDHWVAEELRILTRSETYTIRPEDAWRRVKTRSTSAKFLAVVKELAQFREAYAQKNNIPRNRVFKDDVLMEMASIKPKTSADLGRSRLLQRGVRKGVIAEGILAAVKRGINCPQDRLPKADNSHDKLKVDLALADLLRVLLKSKTESAGVAAKLIASSADLDQIAAGKREVPALSGWRFEVFGEDALKLCEGRIALAAKGQAVSVVSL